MGESDTMTVAVAAAFARLRNDDRVQKMRPGTQGRKRAIDKHLHEVALSYGVDREALAMALARQLGG